ncbi:MAG: hypothetical protein ABIE70_13340 [bacterium]
MTVGFDARILKALAIVLTLTALVGCDSSTRWDSSIPHPPSNPTPRDGATGRSVSTMLSWEAGSGEAGSATYDLHFGMQNPPPLLVSDLTHNAYPLDRLNPEVTYFWRVVIKSESGQPSSSPVWSFRTAATSGDFVFPLAVGSWWEYETHLSWSYSGGGPGPLPPDMLNRYRCEVQRLDTLVGGIEAFYVHQDDMLIDDPRVGSQVWLANHDDGLYSYSGSGGILGIPGDSGTVLNMTLAALQLPAMRIPDRLFAAYDENDSRLVLRYPLIEGSRWVYYSGSEDGWFLVEKEVTGRKTIDTPAGSFDCFEVTWKWTSDGTWGDNVERVEYYAEVGLVYSRIEAKDFSYYGVVDAPGSPTLLDFSSVTQLTGYSVR